MKKKENNFTARIISDEDKRERRRAAARECMRRKRAREREERERMEREREMRVRRGRLPSEHPARRPNKPEQGCSDIWNTLRSMILLHPQARRGRRAPTSWSWQRKPFAAIPPACRRKPASQPTNKPASQPAHRPTSQPASQPANQPTADQPPRQSALLLPSQPP